MRRWGKRVQESRGIFKWSSLWMLNSVREEVTSLLNTHWLVGVIYCYCYCYYHCYCYFYCYCYYYCCFYCYAFIFYFCCNHTTAYSVNCFIFILFILLCNCLLSCFLIISSVCVCWPSSHFLCNSINIYLLAFILYFVSCPFLFSLLHYLPSSLSVVTLSLYLLHLTFFLHQSIM